MTDLNLIIVVAAWLAVVVSVWFIVYFSVRLFLHYRIRKELGDMPSVDELHDWYEQNNSIIQYKQHSPIAKRSELK